MLSFVMLQMYLQPNGKQKSIQKRDKSNPQTVGNIKTGSFCCYFTLIRLYDKSIGQMSSYCVCVHVRSEMQWLMLAHCALAPRSVAGDVAIDNHLAGSTLGGELAQKINQFRQLRFREYMDVCQLCKERNVPLSEGLLKKGALGGASSGIELGRVVTDQFS